MNANQLKPKAIQSIKVAIHDKSNPQNYCALFFETMEEAAKGIESLDINKVHINISKAYPGQEYVSEWEGEPKRGEVYKLDTVQASHVWTKRFFLCCDAALVNYVNGYCKNGVVYFEASIRVSPSGVYPDIGSYGVFVQIHYIDDNGDPITAAPPIFGTYIVLPSELYTTLDKILDHYIDTFASLYSTELLEKPLEGTSDESKDENGHHCADGCCHHS